MWQLTVKTWPRLSLSPRCLYPFVKTWGLPRTTNTLHLKLTKLFLQGVTQLALCLAEESEQHIKAATVWSIGQIGQHTTEHAKEVAKANLMPKLLNLYMDGSSSEDLQEKVRHGSICL